MKIELDQRYLSQSNAQLTIEEATKVVETQGHENKPSETNIENTKSERLKSTTR
jgi:hypothetical protein